MTKRLTVAFLTLLLLTSCRREASGPQSSDIAMPVQNGEMVLKFSMDKYAAMKSFSASCTSLYDPDDPNAAASATKRTIEYSAPNRFKVVTQKPTYTATSVSDGKKQLDYTSESSMSAELSQAPAGLAAAKSTQMTSTMFCGSPIYKFFAGGAGYDALVDSSKSQPIITSETVAAGEPCKVVSFTAKETFGTTEVTIGSNTGLVYQIRFDSAPLASLMPEMQNVAGKGHVMWTQETYTDIKANPPLDDKVFAVSKLDGRSVVEIAPPERDTPSVVTEVPEPMDMDKAPVPLGSPAPPFTVADLKTGEAVSLASLKGSPVLIDFWATWCGPCVKSLPHTQAIWKEYQAKGLKVLAVSREKAKVIKRFAEKMGFSLPVYNDADSSMNKAYGITFIPALALIDRDGNLVDYGVGGGEKRLREMLKKVGL